MANRTTMNVSMTPELDRFVEQQVASGLYQTASEVVRTGLRLLQEREAERAAALDEVRRKITEGLEEARRGDLVDGDEVVREVLDRSAMRRRSTSR